MKKKLFLFLAFVLIIGILSGCVDTKSETSMESVTLDEQMDRTGIDLAVMDYCENVEYFVETDSNGVATARTDFVWDGVAYRFRAQFTDSSDPFNFSDVQGESSWTGSGTLDGNVPTLSAGCEKGSWCAWVRDGIAYVLCCDEEDGPVDAVSANLAFPETWISSDDAVTTQAILTDADLLPCSIWKYEDSEEYLWIMDNETYTTCGADKKPDKTVRFWQKSSDTTLDLLGTDGHPVLTLNAQGQRDSLSVYDSNSRTLREFSGILNDTYYCYLSAGLFDGETLTVIRQSPIWLSAAECESLAPGSVINHSPSPVMAIQVSMVEEVNDTRKTVTDEWDTIYQLTWMEENGAWLMSGDSPSWELAGTCTVTGDTQFSGTEESDLAQCLQNHSVVYANVTVTDGVASAVEVLNTEDF